MHGNEHSEQPAMSRAELEVLAARSMKTLWGGMMVCDGHCGEVVCRRARMGPHGGWYLTGHMRGRGMEGAAWRAGHAGERYMDGEAPLSTVCTQEQSLDVGEDKYVIKVQLGLGLGLGSTSSRCS